MIIGVIYLFIILYLIRINAFFGVFKDNVLNQKMISFLFLLKAMAVPTMYLLYWHFYGGIESFDAGVFYHDSAELNRFAINHPIEYIKAMLGLQNDESGSFFFENYIKNTFNWDYGRNTRFFYNDNRVVIRLHSIVHFFAFQSYFVHALFSCFLSFIGIFWLYRSLKIFFKEKEICLLLILSLFPALWMHTGALLKEGIAVFVMGGTVFCIYQLVTINRNLKLVLPFLILLCFCFLLKPYLLVYAVVCFSLFYIIQYSTLKYKTILYVILLAGVLVGIDIGARVVVNKSLYEIAYKRQVMFSDAAKGGIFLTDSIRFIRLEYDTTLVSELSDKKGYYKIRKNVPYIFWEHSHQQDTLKCTSNQDTNSIYQLAYIMPESNSNLTYPDKNKSLGSSIISGLYYALMHPMFFNAKNTQQYLASFENSLLVMGLFISIMGLLFCKRSSFPVAVLLSFALGECLLIAITSPNTGAIVRYRAPAVVFILVSALYYWDEILPLIRSKSAFK